MYPWLVYLHVAGAFTFLIAHGASAIVAFKLKTESRRERIAALLDLSSASLNVMYSGLMVLLIAGIAAGFAGNWWGQGWIWTALVILVVLMIVMSFIGSQQLGRVRKAAGLAYFAGVRQQPPVVPASDEEIAAAARAFNPLPVAAIGFGGLALILWLMLFKPF